MNTKGRTGYITTEQKETLIEFMKQNPELKLGKFSASFTAKDAQNKWMTLTEELHKIPNGATKEWKQWRKTWQDLCTKTKAKQSHINKYIKRTGGGPSLSESAQLSSTEQQVLETLHTTAISGHDNIAETEVLFEFQDVEYLDNTMDDSQHAPHCEAINMEPMDTSKNYNQATTYNRQNLYTENETRAVINEENIAKATNDKETCKNKAIENIRSRNMTERQKDIQNKKESHKRTVASQRLDNTIGYTNNLVHLTAEDQQIRKKYYRKKIKLMKKDNYKRKNSIRKYN